MQGLTQLPFDDICEKKHGGAETSSLALAKVNRARDREVILGHMRGQQDSGLTLFDLCALMQRLPHHISGRISELRGDGLLYHLGRRDNGEGRVGRVYFLTERGLR